MENIKNITSKEGVDVGYHSSNMHPKNGEGCKGKPGIDNGYTFEEVLKLAYNMEEKPNIIVKAGKNAKGCIKKIENDKIEEAMEKQRWRNTRNYKMYIIEWN